MGQRVTLSFTRLAVVACAVLVANAGAAQKTRTRRPQAHRRPAQTGDVHECSNGISLRLSSPAPTQGSLLLVEVRSANANLTGVKANWNGREIPFWEEKGADESAGSRWRGLLGVDLEAKPESSELTTTAGLSGAEAACSAGIEVKEGKFATERLKVAPNFVKPDPEQLARAEAEGKRLRAIYATVTPERLWQGPFRYPLDGVTTGGNFGKRRILNGTPGSPHGGVDFPAPAGTPVYAAQRGRVVLADALYFPGNTVIVDHGLGLYTFYGHFESIAVQAGETVEAGALLGKVGATGRVTGPHLHWGLSVNRARANPIQLIALFGHDEGRKTEASP